MSELAAGKPRSFHSAQNPTKSTSPRGPVPVQSEAVSYLENQLTKSVKMHIRLIAKADLVAKV